MAVGLSTCLGQGPGRLLFFGSCCARHGKCLELMITDPDLSQNI
jgi:hypothetical protein